MNNTGSKDRKASALKTTIEVREIASDEEVSSCSVLPACIIKTDGGATPEN